MRGLLFIDADRLRDAGRNPVGWKRHGDLTQGRRRQPWAGGCNPLRG